MGKVKTSGKSNTSGKTSTYNIVGNIQLNVDNVTCNVDNILYCIKLMKKAKNLDMRKWQSGDKLCNSSMELHACGNTACFAGYINISKRFVKEFGVGQNSWPSRIINGEYISESEMLSKWLGLSKETVRGLIFNDDSINTGSNGTFYPVPWDQVQPEHVIEKLEMCLRGELV